MDFAYRLHMHYKNIRIFPWNIYYIREYLFTRHYREFCKHLSVSLTRKIMSENYVDERQNMFALNYSATRRMRQRD